MKTRYLTILTTLAFLGFSVSVVAHPCKHHIDTEPEHPHCNSTPTTDPEDLYSVSSSAGSDLYVRGFEWQEGAGKSLDGSALLNLSYFHSNGQFTNDATKCFPANDVALFAGGLNKKGNAGAAKGMFWFVGKTGDGNTEVLYLLQVFGKLDYPDDWPPEKSNVMRMTEWSMKVENEGKQVKDISCLGEGTTGFSTIISVIKTQ